MDGFGADADAVVVTLEGKIFVAAASHEFGVDTELLGPVARDAATDGEDTHFFGGEHGGGELLKIFEGIEAKSGTLVAFASVIIQGEVEAEFGIGESGNEYGNIVFESGFENAAALGNFLEEFADTFVELPTANGFVGIPLFEDAVNDFFDVIEIGFGLERIVDAIVAGAEKFVVIHLAGIVTKVGEAGGFD